MECVWYGVGLAGYAAAFLLSFLAALQVKVFISDDVIYQVISRGIGQSADPTLIGADTYILKDWVYMLWHGSSIGSLRLTSFLFVATGLAFFSIAYMKFVRQADGDQENRNLHFLPLLWLISLGYFLMEIMAAPNSRNVEVGLDFLALYAVAKILTKPMVSWPAYVGLVLWSGLLALNDPYFIYVFLLPLLLWSGYLIITRHAPLRSILYVLGISTGSYATLRAGIAILRYLNFIVVNNDHYTLSALTAIPGRVVMLLVSAPKMFGIDSLTREPFRGLSWLILLSYALLVVLIGTFATRSLLRKRHIAIPPLATLLVIQILVICGIYTISTASLGLGTVRYLVVLPFDAALLLGMYMRQQHYTQWAFASAAPFAILLCIIGLNLSRSVILITPAGHYAVRQLLITPTFNNPIGEAAADNIGNQENVVVAAVIAQSGFQKGYADYWQAPINAYFQHAAQILNVNCAPDGLSPQDFLENTSYYSMPARTSFLVTYKLDGACNSIGEGLHPTHTVPVGWFRVYFYDYDIGAGLAQNASRQI